MTLAGLPPAGTAALGPHRSSIAQPASTPVQRFGPALAGRAAWLGATVGRYSFGVGLFHTQLQAGFIPAHRLSRRVCAVNQAASRLKTCLRRVCRQKTPNAVPAGNPSRGRGPTTPAGRPCPRCPRFHLPSAPRCNGRSQPVGRQPPLELPVVAHQPRVFKPQLKRPAPVTPLTAGTIERRDRPGGLSHLRV